MITSKKQIMSIIKITNMELIDHNKTDLHGDLRDVIFIALANGDVKILDLYAEMDATDIDHWEYRKTRKSKEKVIFKHFNIEDYID